MYTPGLEACRNDLYTAEEDLRKKYPDALAEKVMRVRAMHQWMLSNPAAKDALFISEVTSRFGVSKPTAYSDLEIIKTLLPLLDKSTKEFHRWRFTEMILRTYEIAEIRKDVRTMEKAAATYAKFLGIDKEQAADIPVEEILVQPFVATDDPSVLGIKPVANIRERQRKLLDKYIQDVADIEDIDFEPVDVDEDSLFAPPQINADGETDIL